MNNELWIETLRKECQNSSQRAVSGRIGYSATTISLVLKGEYKGDLKAVKNAVTKKLLCSSVDCPVLGEIEPAICSFHQSRPFAASSSARVRLYRACQNCPFNTKRKDA